MKPKIIKPNSHDEWLAEREKGIGASEVAAILGLSPWDTPFSLWLKKTHQAEPEPENFAMRRGHYLEDAVVQWWQDETGEKVIKASAADIIYVHPDYDFMRATPDRIVRGRKKMLEVKSTAGYMGEEIPDYYLAQCIYQMYVTGIHEEELIYIQGDLTFGRFNVQYDAEFAEFIAQKVKEFWNDSVIGGKEPDLISVSDFTIKGSDPGTTIEADDEAYAQLLSLRTLNKDLNTKEADAEALKDSIKLYMGQNESISFDGRVLATWKTGARGRTFRLKDKLIDELLEQKENGN